MHSGYGSLLKTHIKEAVEVFRQHVILHDNGNVLLNMKDTRQYFVNFVRAGQRTSQELHMLLQGLEKQQSAAAPPAPYRYELLVDGRRTYLGCPIPDGAPPRRHPECHTSAFRMPHVNVPNATPQHVPSVAFTPVKCGISTR